MLSRSKVYDAYTILLENITARVRLTGNRDNQLLRQWLSMTSDMGEEAAQVTKGHTSA